MSDKIPVPEDRQDEFEKCCFPALAGQWHLGRVIICPGCLRFYTAAKVDGVPSWWTGSLPMRESAR